jgi:hypothetical protein
MQGFLSVIKKIAQGAQIGLNIGQQLGLFQADTVSPQAAAVQPNQLELQGFWSIVKKIASTAKTVLDAGSSVGLFSAGVSPQAAAQVQPSDFELQGFWSVIKKIGQGVQMGLNIGQQLGIFSVSPMSAGGDPRAVQLAQALPTLQALIGMQGQPYYGRPH